MRTLLALLALAHFPAGPSLADAVGMEMPLAQFASMEWHGGAGDSLRLPGACCLVDGTCILIEEQECLLSGLFWAGQASCDPNPCPHDLGACCNEWSCHITTMVDCHATFFQGMSCSPDPCTTPMGACCLATSCVMSYSVDCMGLWLQGIGCDPNPCSPDPGACCSDLGCSISTYLDCLAGGGSWWGGLDCEPDPCPVPLGACCVPYGWCDVMDPTICTMLSGHWMGLYVPCDPNPCPQPGACCADDGSCTFILEADCPHGFLGESTVCHPNPCADRRPFIVSILDVDNDQGRSVRITWARSSDDSPGGDPAVTGYEVYRRQDRDAAGPAPGSEAPLISGGAAEDPDQDSVRIEARMAVWDWVGDTTASGDDTYQLVVPTLCDSSAHSGICWSVFFVRALTTDLYRFHDSPPDSGYSVDNNPPGVPTGLHWVSEFTLLGWDEAPEEDFGYFSVYGSDSSQFDEENATLIAYTIEPEATVSGFSYYHVLTADLAGNRGGPATIGVASGVETDPSLPGPGVLALHQGQPNPMRTSITLAFDLPNPADVVLTVFDAGGRSVAVLLRKPLGPGRHEVIWDGRDAGGSGLPTGVYFCRLEADGQALTRKLLLAR